MLIYVKCIVSKNFLVSTYLTFNKTSLYIAPSNEKQHKNKTNTKQVLTTVKIFGIIPNDEITRRKNATVKRSLSNLVLISCSFYRSLKYNVCTAKKAKI